MFVAKIFRNKLHDPREVEEVAVGNYVLQTCNHAVIEDSGREINKRLTGDSIIQMF